MIVEYVQYELPEDQTAAFESAYEEAGSYLSDCPLCLGWELRRCVEEPGRFVARIEWTSQEAHERDWRASPEFASFLKVVSPFGEGRRHMAHWDLIRDGVS
jgi:hemoglobin